MASRDPHENLCNTVLNAKGINSCFESRVQMFPDAKYDKNVVLELLQSQRAANNLM